MKNSARCLWILVLAQAIAFVMVMGWRVLGPRYPHIPIKLNRANIQGGITAMLGMFKVDCGRYPTTEEGLRLLVVLPANLPLKGWHGPYFDPPEIPKDSWGREYVYRFPGIYNTNGFDLYSLGPDGVSKTGGDDLDDINNWDMSSPHGGRFLDSSYADDQFAKAAEMLLVIPFFYVVRIASGFFSRRVRDLFAENTFADAIWLLLSLGVIFTFFVANFRLVAEK